MRHVWRLPFAVLKSGGWNILAVYIPCMDPEVLSKDSRNLLVALITPDIDVLVLREGFDDLLLN